MLEENISEIKYLTPKGIIGFNGHVQRGLRVHPNKKHIIFPIGNKVSIMEFTTHKQDFLSGHTNDVSAIAVSKSGKWLASGQTNHMGFKAYVIVWNFEERSEIFRHDVHKVRVEALCFTCDETHIVSLGGRDDGKLVVWNVEKNAPICGSPATKEVTGFARTISCFPEHSGIFLSAGNANLRLWYFDLAIQKLRVFDVAAGKLRRDYNGLRISGDLLYAGTMSGDIVKIKLNCVPHGDSISVDANPYMLGCFGRHNPKKRPGKDCELYTGGVRDILILDKGLLLIGAGDGSVDMVQERNILFKDYPSPTWPQLTVLKKQKVNGPVTSMQLFSKDTVLIGTDSCEIYTLSLIDFLLKLTVTCNISTVYDIAFPHDFSQVFATASYQSVRIWSTSKMTELLRIIVTNFTAAAIAFTHDGKSIVTGWNDGVIRAFTPLTGKLIYAIPHAHNKGCSALTISKNGKLVVSGGVEGQVRLWKIEPARQSLVAVLKEHVGAVTAVDMNFKENELVSSSVDGQCIIWDLERCLRKHVLTNKNQFTCAKFFPTGVQVLTSGSNKNVCYWESYDGSLVRDVQASKRGAINCISLNANGSMFVTGGTDQLIKLWDYQLGTMVACGVGHAAAIVTVEYGPCGKLIVSGSADGGVFIWNVPENCWPKLDYNPLDPAALEKTKEAQKKRSVEHIEKLETSRSNLSVHITECPMVDSSCQPEVGTQCCAESVPN